MNLLPLLFLLSAAPTEGSLTAAPSKDVLQYEGPNELGTDPSVYAFTTYEPGDKPFLAVDEANLRASASIDAPVVRTLPLGSQVEVLEAVSEATFVKDRVDRWYRVRTPEAEPKEGFVLGNVLTPLSATGDFDGDGKEERLAISFTSDFVVRMRVLEPELSAKRKRAVAALDFLLPEETGRRGGRARLVQVNTENFGAPVPPRAVGLELCASRCVVHSVAYEAKKGVLGSLALAPEAREGLHLRPSPTRPVSLQLESEARGPVENVPCHVVGKVRGGDHDKKDVLSCVVTQPGKSEPDWDYATSYVMDLSKSLRRLVNSGGENAEAWAETLDSKLQRKGYRVVLDRTAAIPGLTPPERLYSDARGHIRLVRRDPGNYVRSAVEVAFIHPTLGTVMTTKPEAGSLKEGHPLASNGFFVPEPGAGFLLYAYQREMSVAWKDEAPEKPSYTLEFNQGCGATKSVDPAPSDVRIADLVEVGELMGAGPLFALKSITHPEMERLWQEVSTYPEHFRETLGSKEVFFASMPRLFWRDSFGRLLRLRRTDLTLPCMAEPIVYFYPEQRMRVRYQLAPSVRVARAEPQPQGNAWTFLATPQGILEEVEASTPEKGRRTFANLFWEGTSQRFAPPAEGFCIPGAQSREFFREVLPKLGLLPHETEDFVAAWAPRMEGAAFHVIGFHPREQLDVLAPVQVTPPPASLIRILMDATPVAACPSLTPPVLPATPPAREGFTVVEWGGVLREGR